METMAIESKSDEDVDDLEDMLLGEEVATMSLMDMYKQTFQEPEPLEGFVWDKDALVSSLVYGVKEASRQLIRDISSKDEADAVKKPLYDYLRTLRAENERGAVEDVMRKLNALIDNDYSCSMLGADEYKQISNYGEYAVRLLVNWFGKRSEVDVVVDQEKKARLKRILQMAIKIGLNYQMLSVFDVKFLPQQYDLADDDYDTYFAERLVPENFKKVKMSDLSASPYWEGIRVVPDMGDYVSVESLNSLKTDQLVNMVKRTTLYRIYRVSEDYRLNLDDATPNDFKILCGLKTLELAPDVHADASRHFVRGTGRMEVMYRLWLDSNQSFKPYRKDVTDDTTFITVPDIPYTAETDVNEVLGDLSLLPGLIRLRNHDDHENEIVKNGDLVLSSVPSDAEFAVELSREFVRLGFLPEGYERYCGVKSGEMPLTRERSESEEKSNKRPRSELFTAIEIH